MIVITKHHRGLECQLGITILARIPPGHPINLHIPRMEGNNLAGLRFTRLVGTVKLSPDIPPGAERFVQNLVHGIIPAVLGDETSLIARTRLRLRADGCTLAPWRDARPHLWRLQGLEVYEPAIYATSALPGKNFLEEPREHLPDVKVMTARYIGI
jgi:hypothetical protein